VVVADPNFTAMYGHRRRRVKTDRRDVTALAEACQRGCYRVAHRRSAPRRGTGLDREPIQDARRRQSTVS
jgi:transposase